ncbi:MAG: Multiple EGF-like-domain protein 3 precursor [Labilithrix sp.]|nr:Multiple EGF-like-domain protein 3 precursor [Labilithrix sp.]
MRRTLAGVSLAASVVVAAGIGCSSTEDGSGFVVTAPGDDAAVSTPEGPVGTFADASTDTGAGAPDAHAADASVPVVCGDGKLGGVEACDDGNATAGDGCSATCTVETGYVCNVPGKACGQLGGCGDARIQGAESCDDGNAAAGDGCSATCAVEPGWACPVLGASCVAAACGDGHLAGSEECDDGDAVDGNGCTNACRVRDGFACDVPGAPCTATVCGDGLRQGTEQCDDGNVRPYDGCSPTCTKEPACPKTGGECAGACGDGILFPGEQCDDGNTRSGDGCSATCTVEPGFSCSAVAQALPASIAVPFVLRDFSRGDKPTIPGSGCDSVNGCPYGHPDFETTNGGKTGMVGKLYNDVDVPSIGRLDIEGKPILVCTDGLSTCRATTSASFAQWYRDVPATPDPTKPANQTFVQDLTLTLKGAGTVDPYYEFDSSLFFPLTSQGFGNQWNGSEGGGDQNFHFTSELRFWFYYDDAVAAPSFSFRGDDDVWVFVNGRLAVDIGGVHGPSSGSLTLTKTDAAALGMSTGHVYEFALFQAERHRSGSNYKVQFRGFVRSSSTCHSICGDGIKSRDEACDDGAKNDLNPPGTAPAYGTCSSDCKARGAYCGNGVVDGAEACDDGVYNGGYGRCKADCSGPGPACGDGVVQAAYGEVCDDGAANDPSADPAYGKCSATCRTRPACGDGTIQAPEACEPPGTPTCSATCATISAGPK